MILRLAFQLLRYCLLQLWCQVGEPGQLVGQVELAQSLQAQALVPGRSPLVRQRAPLELLLLLPCQPHERQEWVLGLAVGQARHVGKQVQRRQAQPKWVQDQQLLQVPRQPARAAS